MTPLCNLSKAVENEVKMPTFKLHWGKYSQEFFINHCLCIVSLFMYNIFILESNEAFKDYSRRNFETGNDQL